MRPLKYEGLSYTEIWISEAQERMVLAVPRNAGRNCKPSAAPEGSKPPLLGSFALPANLQLFYQGHQVADLPMEFLHKGRPAGSARAVYRPQDEQQFTFPERWPPDYTADL